jgi:hypothetical protein
VFGTDGTEVNPSTLERTAGDNEGVTLSLPVPEDQPQGEYSNGAGFRVTVQEPRVTTFDVNNNQGQDVNGGTLVASTANADGANVSIEYNFARAEDVELTVEDSSGTDVTQEILDNDRDIVFPGQARAQVNSLNTEFPGDTAKIPIDPTRVDEGEYTFTVAGAENLDFGEATQSVTTTISADQPSSLSLSEDEAVQGSNTAFSIENSPNGEFHPVVIDESEFRDGVSLDQAEDVFRNGGDTVETGVVDSTGPGATDVTDVAYAYAIIEIDGGNGVGSIETQFLANGSATLELYPSESVTPIESLYHPANVVLTTDDGFETDDEEDLAVVEDEEDGSTIDVTRSVSASEVAPGEEVTVTTEIEMTGVSGAVSTTSSYEPPVSEATIQSVTVGGTSGDPLISSASVTGSTVTLSSGDVESDATATATATATVTVTESLTVGEQTDITHEISGEVTAGETTTEIDPLEVTVAEQSVVDEYDTDNDGTISITELGVAGADFARGELSITELGRLGAAFASGE